MARIFPICSSSSANATFIGTKGHGILIDAGCSFRALKNSLELIDTSMSQIEALFITHEHIDHVKGLLQLTKHTNIPISQAREQFRRSVGMFAKLSRRKSAFMTFCTSRTRALISR